MPRGDTLWKRLESARLPELQKLAEIMNIAEPKAKSRDALIEELSKEIRAAAGYSVINIFRNEHEFPFKQVLIDVADKLAPGRTFLSWTGYKLDDGHSEIEIEEKTWEFYERILQEKSLKTPHKSMDELRRATNSELQTFAITEGMLFWWLGSTAYRKTIPAVLYLIHIRKLRELEEKLA